MLQHSPRCRHAVYFYRNEEHVRDAVVPYVAAALRAGNPAIVIAKPELTRQFTLELHRQHVQGAPFGQERGTFVALDAVETLAKFCLDGAPDATLFDQVIGTAVRTLAANGKRVTAYGEMVGVLCERGRYADAIRLEEMWNGLLAQLDAELFCGYDDQLFRSPKAAQFRDAIRATHTEAQELGCVTA